MAWWTRATHAQLAVEQNWQRMGALQAAAISLDAGRRNVIPKPQPWQQELWGFYDELGEFNYGIEWLANRMSRIRLRAARLDPGIDEPIVVDDGPVSLLVEELAGNPAAQAEILSTLTVHLSIAGESFMVGETINGQNYWRVRSSDELKYQNDIIWMIDDDNSTEAKPVWRELKGDFLITRIWRPHRRFRYRATSPAMSARSIMRELELVNRHIQAQHLSRLASAGILVLPDEITFPVRDAFQDDDDPFIREWIETAREAIATPGTAAAVVPIPMRVPAEYVDSIKHIDFTLRTDDQILAKRESAIRRLATKLDLPAEVLLGMGDVNHWSAWQLDEDAIKTHVQPLAEIIMHGLTLGYLHPRLRAMGEDPETYMVWYDASELTSRPDKSANAISVYDRAELNAEALRRETGFTEEDAPDDEELQTILLKQMIRDGGSNATVAFDELIGAELTVPAEPIVDPNAEDDPENVDDSNVKGVPSTKDNPPPDPGEAAPVANTSIGNAAFTIEQANTPHVLRFGIDGFNLQHPVLCIPKLFSCPFTHAVHNGIGAHPGTPGDYQCKLTDDGGLVVGDRVHPKPGEYLTASGVNGAHSRG